MAPSHPSRLPGWTVAILCGLALQGVHGIPTSSIVDPPSTFFSTNLMAYWSTLNVDQSDGDLWPSTWADDDHIYAANGDGRGFSSNQADFADTNVNRISGTPETGITGERLAGGNALGPIWVSGTYNRKPTGIVAVDGNGDGKDELYLVIQMLNNGPAPGAFNDVPAASVIKSTDYGLTWTATQNAMFTNYVFTTVWFLDFGQSNQHASVLGPTDSKFVYAYGLDNNWRESINGAVPDPKSVYLARAPIDSIQNISAWQWFSGTPNAPAWSSNINARNPVLTDTQVVYPGGETSDGFSVISQGSVVYNAPLNRYLYTSWTDYTFEFYEAPQPWGPWTLFAWKDFGVAPWFGLNTTTPKNGGYATTIPSKFISVDGTKMWVQANWFLNPVPNSDVNYCFSLRGLDVAKYTPSAASNTADSTNNLAMADGTVPIAKGAHFGHLFYLNDGANLSEDSWDGSQKNFDRWGYTWPIEYNMNRVVYTTGSQFPDGGWFASNLKVQVRKNFQWTDVAGLAINPAYPFDNTAVPTKQYTFTFNNVQGDGIQIIGVPGGTAFFTSIAELAVYFA